MAYFYKIMCVKKSAFKKVILSDFFKNTSLSCFGQPSGERQTHFAFFSPLSPSLFPFVQSNSFVMRQFLFPLYAPAFIRAKNALILSHLTARCWLIRSQFLVSVRKKMPCGSFAHPLRARRQPPRLATEHFSFFHDFMG